eukprot:1261543-Rhodomonas_salina.1
MRARHGLEKGGGLCRGPDARWARGGIKCVCGTVLAAIAQECNRFGEAGLVPLDGSHVRVEGRRDVA